MDKLKTLLQKLGIELTADQTKQIKEVIGKEFIPAADAAADKAKLEELTNQLADSEQLQKQLDELNAKYKQDTDDLNAKLTAQEADFAAEKLFSGYKFASDRVRKSVLDEFKGKGFKLENGDFIGGKEYLEGLMYKLINAAGNSTEYTPAQNPHLSVFVCITRVTSERLRRI